MEETTQYYAAAILVALILGFVSVYATLRIGASSSRVKNGPWWTDPLIGGQNAGMYVRMYVALGGTLALNRSEAIYYTAVSDSDGESLRTSCDYRIEGRDMDSRWWSITIYGDDLYLIPNDQERYSYNGMNLKREKDGRYIIHLSQTQKMGNWLPTGDGDSFNILIRLYRPKPSVFDNLEKIELPRIIRGECR